MRKIINGMFGTLVLTAAVLGFQSVMAPAAKADFTAQLQGEQSVPPVSTSASGEANFFVSKNGKEVRYTIYVHDLRDATMAHLHLGMVGANGEPIVWLFLSAQPPKEITGVFSGTLSEGTFTADNLIGLFKGKSIEDLTKEIKSGGVYINVHTKAYPDGEIRGQLHELAGSSK